jgi:hypothetical protein
MTNIQWLLLPAFALVALTLSLVLRTGYGRVRAVRTKRVRPKDVVLDNSKWPDDLRKITNNYQNQFELPVLYYAALALLLTTGLVDGVSIVLSWAFVVSRFVHSFIHTGSNHLLHRFLAFATGAMLLIVLWAWLALRLFVIG